MAKAPLTVSQYRLAMSKCRKPGVRQKRFLRAHVRSPGGESNTVKLQTAAGYRHPGGINLQYGKMAKQIATKAGLRVPRGSAWLSAVVDFTGLDPRGIWRLTIYPEFARALIAENWI